MPTYGQQFDFQMLNDQGILVECIIAARGYTGAVTTLIGGSQPIIISYDTVSDRTVGTRPSYVTLNFIAQTGFTLSDIFAQDERYWQVTINYNGGIYWQGYLTQDNSPTEPFMELGTFELSLTARCGLVGLQGFKFLNGSGYYLFGYITVTQVLAILFQYTGLQLSFVTGVNIYESRHNTSLNALDQTYVNTQRFFGSDGLPMQCSDVLKALCQTFGAICFQRGGYWYFVRQAELPAFPQYVYNPAGSILGGPFAQNLQANYGPAATLKMINADQAIGFDFGYSEVRIKYTFAYLINAVIDGSFYQWSAGSIPANWTNTFTGTGSYIVPHTVAVGLPGAVFYLNSPIDYSQYFQSQPVVCIGGDQLGLSMSFDATNSTTNNIGGSMAYDIIYVSGASVQYLQNHSGTLSWASTRQSGGVNSGIIANMVLDPVSNSYSFSLQNPIICPSGSGQLYIRLYGMTGGTTSTGALYTTMFSVAIYKQAPSNMSGSTVSPFVPTALIFDVTQTTATYTYLPDDIDILLGDSPSPLYAGAMTIDSAGTAVTQRWARKGVTESLPLLQIIANTAMDLHKKAYRLFSGSTYGLMTYGDTFLIQGLTGTNYFVPMGLMLDMKNMQGSMDGVEHDPTAGTYTSAIIIVYNKDPKFQS